MWKGRVGSQHVSIFLPRVRPRPGVLPCLSLLGALVVCACSSHDSAQNSAPNASGGALGTSNDACASANDPVDPTLAIDDFEDGDSHLLQVDGRTGSWWAAGDGTPGASYTPSGDVVPERLPTPRCNSHFALRFSGQGFTDWGALVGLSFAYAPLPSGAYGSVPYDASDHAGVSFVARIGDTSSNNMAFALNGRLAEPTPRPCETPEPVGDGCMDGFSVQMDQLDTNWRSYRIPFDGLQQHPLKGGTLDTHALYSLTFSFGRSSAFDLWIDDLAFY